MAFWSSGGNDTASSSSSSSRAPSWLGLNSDGSLRAGSGSSARSVGATRSVADPLTTSLTQALDRIYEVSERNTARSEAQARELRDWQTRQNQIAMDFNQAEAAKNRDWQKMMSDTAHQREIADLQAAGLNPVLSAMGGNGAAVTSGATASGVTSAGAKGEVDTSANQSLVQLLGTMWSAQTQLESQRLNAQNNLAIAEKNNATSQLVAELYTQQSREASQLAAATSLQQSEISAAVSELVSRINASASYYASNASVKNAMLYTEANKVVAEMQVASQNRNTLVNGLVNLARGGIDFIGGQLNSKRSAQSAMAVAQENHLNSQMGSFWTFADMLGEKFFPSKQFTGFGNSGAGFGSSRKGSGFSR
ncbi:DNA pilot protein [Dipodfec virus RodF1_66]|uniref:DNA pilot protein n=1 Tax=Dipodfec virus RodF1_66 TaxID=2929307 RepID=A0A976N2M1_9VIRU|nr:DNA pilot protein [Dipodfec virus RodF1_66]